MLKVWGGCLGELHASNQISHDIVSDVHEIAGLLLMHLLHLF